MSSTDTSQSGKDRRRYSASSADPKRVPVGMSTSSTSDYYEFPTFSGSQYGSGEPERKFPLFMEEETHVVEYEFSNGHPLRSLLRRRGTGASGDSTLRLTPSPPPSFDDIKTTYASLPSSPAVHSDFSLAPPPPLVKDTEYSASAPPFSLWDYLREEMLATDFDSHQELKWERVSNFLGIPLAIEKMISFGCILCLDSLLHTFTILPIRFMLAMYRAVMCVFSRSKSSLPPSQKADILRALIIITSSVILLPLIDISKIYHSIRGQDTIKLYVIFNALEIADRLLTSIGQDVLDCMFSRSTLVLLSRHVRPTAQTFEPVLFFFLSTLYTVVHSMVLIYQLTSLNVAINAYDNSLLTLLLSNQFVEIKGSVFKKFEKDNLFQITCADIVERFQLTFMLFAIALRNLIELSSSEGDFSTNYAMLPVAFRLIQSSNLIWSIFFPVVTVLASELAVDWLKHAFITKFNHIRPSVYQRYVDVLCRDLAASQGSWVGRKGIARKHTYVDQSPVVARRLGFPSLPTAILGILIGSQSLSLIITNYSSQPSVFTSRTTRPSNAPISILQNGVFMWISRFGPWIALGVISWLCLVTIKLIIGINLLSYATRRMEGMERRAREDDAVNNYERTPIGEGKQEQAYNRELKTMLSESRDDATLVPEIGEKPRDAKEEASGQGGGKRNSVKLEDLTRFTMVKRIW